MFWRKNQLKVIKTRTNKKNKCPNLASEDFVQFSRFRYFVIDSVCEINVLL